MESLRRDERAVRARLDSCTAATIGPARSVAVGIGEGYAHSVDRDRRNDARDKEPGETMPVGFPSPALSAARAMGADFAQHCETSLKAKADPYVTLHR
jgi:hypothetical protein